MNRFIRGDNLDAMIALHNEGLDEAFMLAYFDPPFMTGKVFYTSEGAYAFRDTMDLHDYEEQLAHRIEVARKLLDPRGSIVVHVDPRVSHRVRVILDSLFGADHFADEIVWRYRRWPSGYPSFQAVHDVLIRYRRNVKYPPRWTQLYEPAAASTTKKWGTKKQHHFTDENGKRQSTTIDVESKGVPLGDVWEIGIIPPTSKDRLGFPTQKPLELLSRLVVATTEREDLVLEGYAGSGPCSEAAYLHGRRFVAIDDGDAARKAFRARMRNAGVKYTEEKLAVDTG